MGKKKFIDKKKSATFQLIARDSSDPNYDEGPSGDSVFVRVDENPYSFEGFNESNAAASNDTYESDSIFADAPDDYDDEDAGGSGGVSRRQLQSTLMPNGRAVLPDNIRKEILELGFPDDGYNYLAHLREIKNTGGGSMYYQNPYAKLDQQQPDPDVKAYDASRVDISKFNGESNEKSIYNVASRTAGVRIQKVIDPEVAALLDDSDMSRFGSDVEDLEEDFVVNANLPEEATKIDIELDKELNFVDETVIRNIEGWVEASDSQQNVAHPSVGKGKKLTKGEGDWINEKPRVRRLLDEQFDMLELQEYGSDSEGEYDGSLDDDEEYHEPLAQKLNHSLKSRVKDELDENYIAPSDLLHGDKALKDAETLEGAANVIQRCMEYAEKYENEKTDEEVFVQEESSEESENYDCETIVSTYSNLDNHPGKIGVPGVRRKKFAETIAVAQTASNNVISLKGKLKLPVNFSPSTMGSAKEKVKNDTSLRTGLQTRKQHGQESKEEKKERKAAVKEERREARRTKKEMKGLYKGEGQHAQKVAAFTGPSSIHLM